MTDPNVPVKQEPALIWQTTVGPALIGLTFFLNLSPDVQGLVNAVIVGAMGVIAMFGVDVGRAVPLLTGLATAVLALIGGLGVDVPSHVQAGVMAVLTALVGFWTRTQVQAKLTKSSVELVG